MFTILIVDDEKEEREGVAFLLEELKYPLAKVFARNGREALSYLAEHPVDILFTDVRMPIMDGLELAAKAKVLLPDLEIIIFSGFSEFEYAKTAISIGVASYILKPVKVEEFQETMDLVVTRLAASRQHQADIARQELYAHKHLLLQLINRSVHQSKETEVLLTPCCQYSRMMLLEFDNKFFDMAGSSFEKSILSILQISADYLNLNMCQSLLFFKKSDVELSYYEEALKIHLFILEHHQQDCYIALSSPLSSASTLSYAYMDLEQLMEYRFFTPNVFVFDRENTFHAYLSKEGLEETEEVLMEMIKNDLKKKDFTSLNLHIDVLCGKYERKLAFSHLYIKFVFSSLYRDILAELGPVTEQELNQTIDRLYRSNDIHEIVMLIKETLRKQEETYTQKPNNSNREIDMVKKYITEHYGDDLDLVSLAAQVYLSPRYLSNLFIKITGCGINKYIKSIRMEKAKELLEQTNIKIVDLCTSVGFKNLSYFCQNFREFYGETPEQYRNADYYHSRSVDDNFKE